MLAILVQMYLDDELRLQLLLSLASWAALVLLVLFSANRWFLKRRPAEVAVSDGEKPHRVLVMANQTVDSDELIDELRRIDADTAATYFVVVPANPIDTGAAATHGPLDVTEAIQQAAQERLDNTLAILRSENLEADGTLGDYRPLRALSEAVDSFEPDRIVIATLPPEFSVWHRSDVIDGARAQYDVPVTHVVATSTVASRA